MRFGVALMLVALTLPAATAAAPDPAFRVTISATEDISATSTLGPGCVEHLSRHLEIRNAKPLTLTASKLGYARNFSFELTVTETRSDSYEAGCDSAEESPTSSCGTVTYTVGSVGTGVGFLNKKTDKFILFYTRISTDPYAGGCGVHQWGVAETPGSNGKVWVDNWPASPLGPNDTTPVDRAKLTAHKRFVVRWQGSADSSYSNLDEHVAASWTVICDPIS